MRVLWCLLSAALLIAGCGSTIKGGNVVKSGVGEHDVAKVDLTKVAKLDAANCIDEFTDDDTEYCIILEIDGGVPTVSGPPATLAPGTYRLAELTGQYYALLPGEHRITLRNRLEEPREIIEMSFVAEAGHWYSVMAKSRKFPQWRFYVYDDTSSVVIAHVGDKQ